MVRLLLLMFILNIQKAHEQGENLTESVINEDLEDACMRRESSVLSRFDSCGT